MFKGLFRRLFWNKGQEQNEILASVELAGLRKLNNLMNNLLAGDHYVPRSEYAEMIKEYNGLHEWFKVLKDSGTLDVFCHNNGTSDAEIHGILSIYEAFPSLIDLQNEQFIKSKISSEKEYLDSILKDSDPNILLDDDQRRVVLTMVQTVDVIAIFDKMMREPKPVRFKVYDSGHWKSVNVERIYNIEWIRLDGKVQIVYNCACFFRTICS